MLTFEELEAELEARRCEMVRWRFDREAVEISTEAREGRISPLDDVYRRLHLHPMVMATHF